MYLMCGDIKVMEIDVTKGVYNVLNNKLLPYPLKNVIVPVGNNRRSIALSIANNYNAFISFLSNRVLALSRSNAKKILNILNLEQTQSDVERAKAAIFCKAVSVVDNYWLCSKGTEKWCDYDIRRVSLNSIVAQIALHGSSLTLNGKDIRTPELTTHGAYAKCWKRESGDLWLYKRGDKGSDYESKVEVCVSKILDKTNLKHVVYEDATSMGKYCCRCRCMSDDNRSILSGVDFYAYCSRIGTDFNRESHRIDPEMMYGMHIIDYLISNVDRHGGNWGFYYDSNTTDILCCHPLFDHNNAFDKENMKVLDGGSCKFFSGKTMLDTARFSLNKCGFKFTEKISRADFMNETQYRSFKRRAKALGISV